MNDHQTTILAAAISTAGPIIAVMIGIFVNSRQIDSLRREMESRFDSLEKIFTEKLRRVEEVMESRLKRLEAREH